MATMALMGTETIAVTDELERQLAENPILDKNDRKLLDQLQDSLDDAETSEQTFGLHDLSLENFRQDLLEFLGDKGDVLRNMPNGIFSGFKTVDSLFDEVPESIVALVAYPHKPTGVVNHRYTDYYLVLRPVNNERQEHVKVFNRQEILGHAEKSVAGLPKKTPCSDTESNNRMYLCTWKINQQYMNQ